MTNPSTYIDDGYFEDGYVFNPCPQALISGSTRVNLRGPNTMTGSVRLLQPGEYSTGWARIGYAPRAIIHTMVLGYNRMSEGEKNDLDALFDVVDFSATQQFMYTNTGDEFPIYFEAPQISFEESSYGCYRSTISLWAAQTFFPAPAVPVTISALLSAAHYPAPVTRAKKQPRTRLSDGSVVVYNKSTITRTTRTLSLVRISADDLGSLIAHFISVDGVKTWWTWTSTPSVLVEEGTTNQMYNPTAATTDGWYTYSGQSSTVTLLPGTPPSGVTAALSSLVTATNCYVWQMKAMFTYTHTYSVWVYVISTVGPGKAKLAAWTPGAGPLLPFAATDIVERDQWVRKSLTFIPPVGIYAIEIGVGLSGATAGDYILSCNHQLEEKSTATSFVVGTRPDSYTTAVTSTCRYATSELTWQRSHGNTSRYDVQVAVEEDL